MQTADAVSDAVPSSRLSERERERDMKGIVLAEVRAAQVFQENIL
jgi:hypothetical protein